MKVFRRDGDCSDCPPTHILYTTAISSGQQQIHTCQSLRRGPLLVLTGEDRNVKKHALCNSTILPSQQMHKHIHTCTIKFKFRYINTCVSKHNFSPVHHQQTNDCTHANLSPVSSLHLQSRVMYSTVTCRDLPAFHKFLTPTCCSFVVFCGCLGQATKEKNAHYPLTKSIEK